MEKYPKEGAGWDTQCRPCQLSFRTGQLLKVKRISSCSQDTTQTRQAENAGGKKKGSWKGNRCGEPVLPLARIREGKVGKPRADEARRYNSFLLDYGEELPEASVKREKDSKHLAEK